MEASQNQKELLAKLYTEDGAPTDPTEFEGMDSIKIHKLINQKLASRRGQKKDYSEYFALEKQLGESGYQLTREEIVAQHTKGQKTGLRQLTNKEYYSLLKMLRDMLAKTEDPALAVMRRKIISLMRRMGYEMDGKADMKRIYTWVKRYGKFHKPLNSHTKAELAALTTQVELMYNSHLQEVHKQTTP